LLALLARKPRLAGLLAGWWTVTRFRELRRRGGGRDALRALPIEMTMDVVTGAALVVGSVRAGSLVL
jgi:hypothetical protein